MIGLKELIRILSFGVCSVRRCEVGGHSVQHVSFSRSRRHRESAAVLQEHRQRTAAPQR